LNDTNEKEEEEVERTGDAKTSNIPKSEGKPVTTSGKATFGRSASGTTSAPAALESPDSLLKIADGVAKVRSDSDSTNWVLYRFDGAKKNIHYHSSGSGGYSEFVQEVADDLVMFGLLRYDLADDSKDGGFRPTKFVFVTWIGPDVNALVRAKANAETKRVAREMSPYHIAHTAENFEDLDPALIVNKLKSVGFHM
jgi:hypothetical protein